MLQIRRTRRPALAASLLTLCLPPTFAQDDINRFTVGNIRIEGLQRISEGTVYNYLPVNPGDDVNARKLQEALKALYKTGFFRDAELRRDGSTLIVVVAERPSIESFTITGNKEIKTAELEKSARKAGLASGKTFDRSVLEGMTQYLTEQYFAHGRYGVDIDTRVTDVPGNKVKIDVAIKEGRRAQIRQINIVGNEKFSDEELLGNFSLKTPNWLSWYKQDDRYAREALQGDQEKLRSFYMDRGYANFKIEPTQVAVSPEKDAIFITVNIDEGDAFKIGDVKLTGNLTAPEEELKHLILVKPGQVFSNKDIVATEELITRRLGEDGYAFAKVDPVPSVDENKKEVSLTFHVEPGGRVYVRHINFLGLSRTEDETLRRELRQFEGAWVSNNAIELSKRKLERLPFVKKVDTQTTPVEGSPDMLDVDITVEEGPSATLMGGLGYGADGFSLSGEISEANFRGKGERLSLQLNKGAYASVYGFSHTNPAVSMDGVRRTVGMSYRTTSQLLSNSASLSTKSLSTNLGYDYPVQENQYLHMNMSLLNSQVLSGQSSSLEAIDWVRNNGRPFSIPYENIYGSGEILGTKFRLMEFSAGWSLDSRNRVLFPDRGMFHSLSLSSTLPGSEVEYWMANYKFAQYVPLWRGFTLEFSADVGYGRDIGSTEGLPPFKQFYTGGPMSVRGFKENTLGPKDSWGDAYGGNLELSGHTELIIPLPEKVRGGVRLSAFYDIGNVFSTGGPQFLSRTQPDGSRSPLDYRFGYKELRRSTGLAVQWLAPMGLFRFSYARPLNARKSDGIHYADETEGFQFSIGQAF